MRDDKVSDVELPESSYSAAETPPAVIHVDLDGAQDIYGGHGWSYPYLDDPLFESGMENFLRFFEENGLTATLFVIANSLNHPRKRFWIGEAVKHGHEIASHTVTHRYLPSLKSSEKRREIAESRQMLEDATGLRVCGFRAPGYRIDRESMELLAECGYEYDASAFPTPETARLLGVQPSNLCDMHFPVEGNRLVSWPMPDHRPLPFPFNPSYSLILGNWYFRYGLSRFRQSGRPLALLFHLTDVSDPLAGERMNGFKSRVLTLSTLAATDKLRRCLGMLELVRRDYRITTTQRVLDDWRKAQFGNQGGVCQA
jgi:hypothetical protein